MKTKDRVIELRKQGLTVPQICKELNIGKGTVGFHLKGLNINFFKDKQIKTKRSVLEVKNISIEDFIKMSLNSSSIAKLSREINISSNGVKYLQKKHDCFKPNRIFHNLNYENILNGSSKTNDNYYNNSRGQIKKYIINNNLLSYECSSCGCNNQWLGKTMPLILDHKNGINNDHRLENLRFLCSNCDSIQDTYKGRNKN